MALIMLSKLLNACSSKVSGVKGKVVLMMQDFKLIKVVTLLEENLSRSK
jgi:hypothetical protein